MSYPMISKSGILKIWKSRSTSIASSRIEFLQRTPLHSKRNPEGLLKKSLDASRADMMFWPKVGLQRASLRKYLLVKDIVEKGVHNWNTGESFVSLNHWSLRIEVKSFTFVSRKDFSKGSVLGGRPKGRFKGWISSSSKSCGFSNGSGEGSTKKNLKV